jgi:threonine aldolase
MATREIRATVELQNREIVRSRALHVEIEPRERERAESKSVTQATEAVLVLKKQRISELEAVRKEMAAKEDGFAAEKAEHESLRLQFRTLEAEHADAVDIANGLFEGEAGNTPAELNGQNRALEQQLREKAATGWL